jgi:hypothetical protein
MALRLFVLGIAAVVSGCAEGPGRSDEPVEPGGEWLTLLDGEGLDAWTPVGDANWQMTDGAVQADTGTGFLLSKMSYGDFDLDLEFFVSPDANSGVFVRCSNPAEIGAATCYEVNIFDQRPDPAYRTGAIVNVAQPLVMIDTGDRWNRYEISAHGQRLIVKLNGETTVDTEDDKLAQGPIALQYGAGRVMFRNVRIRTH